MYKENDDPNTEEIEKLMKMKPDDLEKMMLEKEAEVMKNIKKSKNL